MFAILKVKDKEYKLRMSSKTSVECEKSAGKAIIELAVDASIESQIILLHYLLKDMNNGFDREKVYQLRDELIENGMCHEDIAMILAEGLAESGFIKKEALKIVQEQDEK